MKKKISDSSLDAKRKHKIEAKKLLPGDIIFFGNSITEFVVSTEELDCDLMHYIAYVLECDGSSKFTIIRRCIDYNSFTHRLFLAERKKLCLM